MKTQTNNIPQTNEEKFRRKIFEYKAKEGWLETATGLQRTAEILKSSRKENEDYPDIIWHELMIWGFCVENLLKGLYSKKQEANLLRDKQAKPLYKDGKLSVGKGHDLEIWCQRADVINFTSPDHKRILKNLTQIIIHHGRYPVSTQWNNSEGVYWESDKFDRILMQMIKFLKQEIGEMESALPSV